MILTLIGGAVMAALLLANVAATIRVVRSRDSSAGQKAAQALLVWLLPALGAGLALALTHHAPRRSRSGSDGGLYGDADGGDGLMDDNSHSSDTGGGDASSGGDGGGH